MSYAPNFSENYGYQNSNQNQNQNQFSYMPSPVIVDEIQLCESSQDREIMENMADLYTYINVIGRLEEVYMRGSVEGYDRVCIEYLSKYKIYETTNNTDSQKLRKFANDYSIPKTVSDAAIGRIYGEFQPPKPLIRKNMNKLVLEAGRYFIIVSYAVDMEVEIDSIQPLLSDLVDALSGLTNLNFKGRDI